MRLGPEGFNKIAILGTSQSSQALAPFKDKTWAIWACSPGSYPICAKNRSDVWFEPHRWMPTPPGHFGEPGTKPWFSPEFNTFLAEHKGPVFMTQTHASIPNSVAIPYQHLIEKYGPYFFTSTVAYMLALAIDELAPRAANGEEVVLGLWGIDMSATEEYAYQRPGCQHFLGLAMSLGIHVVLPAESDLMRPPTMYGIGEHSPRHIRISARLAEAQAQLANLTAQHEQIVKQTMLVKGMISEQEHLLASWTDDVQTDLRRAVSFSSEFVKPAGSLKEAVRQVSEPSTGAAVVPMEAKTG